LDEWAGKKKKNSKKLFHFNYYLKEMPNLLVLYVYFHNTQFISTSSMCFISLSMRHKKGKKKNWKDKKEWVSERRKKGFNARGYCLLKRTHEVFLDYVNFFLLLSLTHRYTSSHTKGLFGCTQYKKEGPLLHKYMR
jgi:hypothetical protein